MNPYSQDMLRVWYSYRALHGLDENCADYIAFCATSAAQAVPVAPAATAAHVTAPVSEDGVSALQKAIAKGRVELAGELTADLLGSVDPLVIVQDEIIPALDRVGKGFEEKTVYLPQLLMSAEAAKSAFSRIKAHMQAVDTPQAKKATVVIATVHGDIHDIGKNIVRLLLENYGFDVIDLGKDVAPEAIVSEVVRTHAPLVGLSALMTTTVPAMEETVKQLRAHAPWCKIMVGGAVLNADYAARIGADRYCKDAMESVRYAELI